jgi:hypothetical protein
MSLDTMASVAAPGPIYTLPPHTTQYRNGTEELRVQDHCLSYIKNRFCRHDPLIKDASLTLLARVRISEGEGHYGGQAGTWKICQVESGSTFAAFKPTDGSDGTHAEIGQDFWPADLHPIDTTNRQEIEIFRKDVAVAGLNVDTRSDTDTDFFVQWRNLETSVAETNPMNVKKRS